MSQIGQDVDVCNVIIIGTKRPLEAPSTDVLLVEPPHPTLVEDSRALLTFPYLYDVATQEEGCACGFQLYCEAAHTYMAELSQDEQSEIMETDRTMFERREHLIEFIRVEVEASGEVEVFATIYDPQNHLLTHDPTPVREVTVDGLYEQTLEGPVGLRVREGFA